MNINIQTLLNIVVAAIILYILYLVLAMVVSGTILQLGGLLLVLVFIGYVGRTLGLF